MDTDRIVVSIDPTDTTLGINARGELVRVEYTPLGPLAIARAVETGTGWLRFEIIK